MFKQNKYLLWALMVITQMFTGKLYWKLKLAYMYICMYETIFFYLL